MIKSFIYTALAATALSVAVPAMAATQIPDGSLRFADTDAPDVHLGTAPTLSTINFNDVTVEFTGKGGFSGATGGSGLLNGVVSFLNTEGTSQAESLSNFFVFTDGSATGDFYFSADKVTTQSFNNISSNSFILYLEGYTNDPVAGYSDTRTSITLSFTQTGGPTTDWQASGTLAVPPTASVPEPASWAMMVGGFGLLGGALRRKRTTTAVSFG